MKPEDCITQLLLHLGEDCSREGLRDTPSRVIRAYEELTSGNKQDPHKILGTVFTSDYDEMIIVNDIPFVSLCEHHLMPFWGKACIGYVPNNGKIVGLSKLPRLVQCYARRLQIQEQLTQQIAKAINDILQPMGVGVLLTGTHSCMHFRGINSHGSMTTSCLLGVFKDKPEARAEFLDLARSKE